MSEPTMISDEQIEPEPPADYWLNNYGDCLAEPCRCRRVKWTGQRCVNWQPLGARSFSESLEMQRLRTKENG